jgi:acyl carrier protein
MNAATPSRNEGVHLNVHDILSSALKRPAPQVTPSTMLANIPGWDSVIVVRLMLAIEEAVGRELLESEIEAVTTVADVEKLLSSG